VKWLACTTAEEALQMAATTHPHLLRSLHSFLIFEPAQPDWLTTSTTSRQAATNPPNAKIVWLLIALRWQSGDYETVIYPVARLASASL
jgi:hypothetical protein